MAGAEIRVAGLRDFKRELKTLEDNALWIKRLKELHHKVASIVIAEARATAASALERKAASGGLTAGKTVGGAVVRLGGKKYPFTGGAEFGALQYPQFKPWRGNQFTHTLTDSQIGEAGYFLYPAIAKKRDEVIDLYMDEIQKLAAQAFPD